MGKTKNPPKEEVQKEVVPQKKSYYNGCVQQDIISVVRPLISAAGYKLRDCDGKFIADTTMAFDTPWHHVYHHPTLNCHLWNKIIFEFVSMAQEPGKRFVPRKCQECFKVVVRPNTLFQLFSLLELQKGMGRPAKCGIEVRDTVSGLYGGYFYNVGLENGLECYTEVRKAVDAHPNLGPDVKVLLKRACTEYELECGDSDKWEVTPEQNVLEDQVETLFINDIIHRTQPDHVIALVHRRWIEWAYAHNDETYKPFTNDEPLYPPYVTYHHLAEEGG